MAKKALITGISGQDGSYLAELLLSKGYEVHGLVLRNELEDPDRALFRLSGILGDLHLHPASIESYPSMFRVVEKIKPEECYHLAAQSFVSYSFDDEFSIFNTNVTGTHNILSVLKEVAPNCRFYFAGSSELFGRATESPQNENTAFHPRSAYGITKATGYYLTSNYRENYGMFACNGILYNHESPRRGYEFVTRKISYGAAQIKLGLAKTISLGNLDAVRDWGFAGDYVKAMWLILQQEQPGDYVIATGEIHSVRDFCDVAFSCLGLDYRDHVNVDQKFFRPAEAIPLMGDPSKARNKLNWQPSVDFRELVEMMVMADFGNLKLRSNDKK
ncbi:MAG: GDP-mannose 4,6-dehydratase [Anaerolineaceae bacterium]|nr:GDP-mannose 4,6-dehydratase [Anaerolineaceae bacterium]